MVVVVMVIRGVMVVMEMKGVVVVVWTVLG